MRNSNKFKITPEALGEGNIRQIEECLRVGGLYRNKARTIKNVARTIFDRYEGNISPLLYLSLEQARKQLMQFQGVGPKTADVVLLFSAGNWSSLSIHMLTGFQKGWDLRL